MSRMENVISRAEEYRKDAVASRARLFRLIVLFSTLLSLLGLTFGFTVYAMVDQLTQTAIALAEINPEIGTSESKINTENIAGTVGDNSIWVPIISGVSLILLSVVYLFRIYVKRVIVHEDTVLSLLKLQAIEKEDMSERFENAVISSALNKDLSEIPGFVPTVEIAEKSVNSISNIVSKIKQ